MSPNGCFYVGVLYTLCLSYFLAFSDEIIIMKIRKSFFDEIIIMMVSVYKSLAEKYINLDPQGHLPKSMLIFYLTFQI